MYQHRIILLANIDPISLHERKVCRSLAPPGDRLCSGAFESYLHVLAGFGILHIPALVRQHIWIIRNPESNREFMLMPRITETRYQERTITVKRRRKSQSDPNRPGLRRNDGAIHKFIRKTFPFLLHLEGKYFLNPPLLIQRRRLRNRRETRTLRHRSHDIFLCEG